jgi:hypothetical protein
MGKPSGFQQLDIAKFDTNSGFSGFSQNASQAMICEEGYVLHDDICYLFDDSSTGITGTQTYAACHATCAAQGAAMLCVPGAALQNWLYSVNTRNTWLGIDKGSGSIVWREGCNSNYTNFYPGMCVY